MTPKLHLRSLAFYGSAILLVVGLFQIVTHYGNQLQAAPPLQGRYRLTLPAVASCTATTPVPEEAAQVVLTIQQSGIYLSAFLLSGNNPEQALRSSEKRPTLAGRWNPQQIAIAGVANFQVCAPSTGPARVVFTPVPTPVRIVFQPTSDGATLQGQLSQGSGPGVEFSGQREASAAPKPASH